MNVDVVVLLDSGDHRGPQRVCAAGERVPHGRVLAPASHTLSTPASCCLLDNMACFCFYSFLFNKHTCTGIYFLKKYNPV